MYVNKSMKSLFFVASAVAIGALLGGCDSHSKPDLNDVKSALQERYGECPLWTLSNVQRVDGASNPDGYEISYSFVLTVKDPGALIGHGANVSKQDAMHLAAAMFGDTSDPCFYGLFPLATVVSQEQQPLPRNYQGGGDRIFVRSEQGWHLSTAPLNPRDSATYDRFSPIDDATPAASQGGNADGVSTASGASAGDDAAPAVATSGEASAPSLALPAVTPASGPTANAGPALQDGSNARQVTTSVASSAPSAPEHSTDTPGLEGDWQGTYQCGPYIGSGSVSDPDAWTAQVTMTVHNGQATLVRQSGGEAPFREVLAGNVLPDLSLPLTGTGQNVGADHPWYVDFMGRFAGNAGAATFQASGTLSDWHRDESRACRLALSR